MDKIKINPIEWPEQMDDNWWFDCTVFTNGEWKQAECVWGTNEYDEYSRKRYCTNPNYTIMMVGDEHNGFEVYECHSEGFRFIVEVNIDNFYQLFFVPTTKDLLDLIGYLTPKMKSIIELDLLIKNQILLEENMKKGRE